jgi:hypothetical protein
MITYGPRNELGGGSLLTKSLTTGGNGNMPLFIRNVFNVNDY